MAHPDLQADAQKPWSEVVQEYDIRECVRCTSMIANHRAYGRPPQPTDPTLCECCEPEADQYTAPALAAENQYDQDGQDAIGNPGDPEEAK